MPAPDPNRLPPVARPSHYDLELVPYLDTATFTGTEAVTVELLEDLDEVVLHALDLDLTEVWLERDGERIDATATYDPAAWAILRAEAGARVITPQPRFHGSDRDGNAIAMAQANAANAGVAEITVFSQSVISDLTPPEGAPGLVIVNPPYGARIGDKVRIEVELHNPTPRHSACWRT